MKKLTRADIRGPKLYEPIRDDLRARVIELKRARRLPVGPEVTLVFENRATMIFQIEEMCRAERIEAAEKIAEEIEVYNRVLPDEGQLAATLLVEITDEAQIATTLERLVGLQDHVWLLIDGERVRAAFDPDQFQQDRLAAVQYLRFTLTEEARRRIATPGCALQLAIDHPRYRHSVLLSETTRASLANDLAC
jgi:hypothetical protein